ADRLHDGLLYRLVAGVPALLQDRVVDQFVTGLTLGLTGREAALGVAARLATAIAAGAAERSRRRRLDSPEQADQGQQRRSQALTHDFASSSKRVGRFLRSPRAKGRKSGACEPSFVAVPFCLDRAC